MSSAGILKTVRVASNANLDGDLVESRGLTSACLYAPRLYPMCPGHRRGNILSRFSQHRPYLRYAEGGSRKTVCLDPIIPRRSRRNLIPSPRVTTTLFRQHPPIIYQLYISSGSGFFGMKADKNYSEPLVWPCNSKDVGLQRYNGLSGSTSNSPLSTISKLTIQ